MDLLALVRAVAPARALRLALGAGGQLAPDLDPRLYRFVALGAPWLVTAFAAGALVGDHLRGAVAGAVALVTGTLAQYTLRGVGWNGA